MREEKRTVRVVTRMNVEERREKPTNRWFETIE